MAGGEWMRRGYMALGMVLLTAAAVGVMLSFNAQEEKAVQARIERVTRGDVLQIAALSGRLGYREEMLAYAALPGRVEEIYVAQGQRVTRGQALLRLSADAAERAAAVWAQQESTVIPAQDVQALLEGTIVRAPENAVVRRLLVQEHAPVTLGTPVAALSSSDQVIRCAAAEADARDVRAGMPAQLSVSGEVIGMAEVTQVGPVTADAATGRLLCEVILVPEQRLDLPQGAAVEADVLLAGSRDVTMLPLEAITGRDTVWQVIDGICTEIPAEIVLSDEMHAWVRLPEGIEVAVGEFREGQRVIGGTP